MLSVTHRLSLSTRTQPSHTESRRTLLCFTCRLTPVVLTSGQSSSCNTFPPCRLIGKSNLVSVWIDVVSDEQRRRGTSWTHLSLVFRLEPQPSLDAAPRLQKGLALSPVRQVTDEDPRGVHTHEQHSLSCYLKHTHTHTGKAQLSTSSLLKQN